MVIGALSYDNAVVGSGSILNDDERSYNAFGQLAADQQSHSGAVVSGTSPQTQYAYDSGSSNDVRPTSMTYPNGRIIYYNYNNAGDVASTSAAVSRLNAICTNTTRGTNDVNVIASYDYVSFRFMRETYSTPKVRLDYWGGTSGTYTGWDNFNRTVSQDWVNYSGTATDVFKINHGYDQDSNRLYAQNTVYGGASQVYQYDTLNRLTQYTAGSFNATSNSIQPYWTRAGQQWTLDVVGNQTAVGQWDNGTGGFLGWNQTTFDKANKPTGTYVRANAAKSPISDPFTSNTAANWVKPGSGDAFNVNSSNAGNLTVTTIAQDTVNSVQEDASQALLLLGENTGPLYMTSAVTFPSGTGSGNPAGMVFGYKSWTDYWLLTLDTSSHQSLYHVLNGAKGTAVNSSAWPVGTGSPQFIYDSGTRRYAFTGSGYSYGSSGNPSGKVGLLTTFNSAKFGPISVYEDSSSRDMAGRWTNWIPNLDGLNAVYPSTSRYKFSGNANGNYHPSMLKNLRLGKFQAVFSVKRESGASSNNVDFILNGTDQDDCDYLTISHSNTQTAPTGNTQVDGAAANAASGQTQTVGNVPALGASDILWVQVADTGSAVTVKEQVNNTGTPTSSSWAGVSNCYSCTGLRSSGGMIGFKSHGSVISVAGLTVSSYDMATSSFDITEAQDNFAVDSNSTHSTYGMAADTDSSDANGNLTYDGDQSYTYDAWNRLMTVSHGYRDSSNTLQHGQALDTFGYDGLGRRVVKAVSGTGAWDCTYHYYLDKDSVIEERNGSNQTIKQFVWGKRYIDELVQVSINSNPAAQSTCDVPYWACTDANWNVIGLINSSGGVVERYE